jgi:hypothetical protein
MAKERLSRLQKTILVTLYQLPFKLNPDSKYRDTIHAKKNDLTKIAELEFQGYKFYDSGARFGDPETLIFHKYFPDYSLSRSKLLYSVNRWQDYNDYKPGWDGAGTVRGARNLIGTPPGFGKKQVAFTRSLQILAGKDLILPLSAKINNYVEVYGNGFAKRLNVESHNFEMEREAALEKEKEKWRKEKAANPIKTGFKATGTFDKWWSQRLVRPLTGRYYNRKSVWESCYNVRRQRNIKRIRLTPKGIKKAEELLKVNYFPPVI